MRIDFYAWMEERWVRLLTMGVDLNVGLNLTVTKDANMKPAIQPMLVGVDAKNVTIRVSNTDLLQETPAALEAVFPSLINIATGALGGVVKPIALPSVAGFSLDNLQIQRVQTSQDDFVAIYGTHHHRHAGAARRLVEPERAAHVRARCASTPPSRGSRCRRSARAARRLRRASVPASWRRARR